MLLTLLQLHLLSLSHALSDLLSLSEDSLSDANISPTISVTISNTLPRNLLPWNSTWQVFDKEAPVDGKDAIPIDEAYDDYTYKEDKERTKNKRDKNSKNVKSETSPAKPRCVRKDGSEVTKSSPPSFRLTTDKMQQLSAGHLGHRVELFCPHRKGCPRAKVEWLKDGQSLLARGRKSGLSTIRIKQNGALIIEDNRLEDDGIYTCMISNQFGSIQHNIRVQSVPRAVAMKPKVHHNQPGNHSVVVGTNLTLLCQLTVVDVSSPHHIVWYKHYAVNGSWLDSNGKVYANFMQDSQSSPPPADDQKLQLTNLNLTDTGWYSCAISNQYGRLVRSGWVEVVEMLEEQQVTLTLSNPLYTYLAVVIGGVIGLGLTCLLGVLLIKYRREREEKLRAVETAQCVVRWTKKIIIERNLVDEAGTEELLTPIVRVEKVLAQDGCWPMDNDMEESYEFQLDMAWEFPRELLELGQELGHGAFGRVVRGTAYNCRVKSSLGRQDDVGCPLEVCASNVEPIIVAVKMLKENHSEEDVLDLVKEIEMMKVVGGHVNIVNLLAACTQPSGQPLLAIMEFAELGNLRDYLRSRRGHRGLPRVDDQADHQEDGQPVSLREMLNYAWQVGRGMQFLSSRRCVHRDLAARNVLVASRGVVKIADFGLARDVEESDYYRKVGEAKLPVLWMSPESLFAGVSTTKSDVWSFGVLLWEIVTCGEKPYTGVAAEAVLDLIKDGYRMSIPPQCPQHLYVIMRDCWHIEPSSRPSWSDLVSSLHSLYHQTLPGVYLDLALPNIPTPPSSPENSHNPYIHTPPSSTERSSPVSSRTSPSTTSSSVFYPGYMPGISPLASALSTPTHQPTPLLPTSPPPLSLTQVSMPSCGRRMSEESGYNSNTGGGGQVKRYYNVT